MLVFVGPDQRRVQFGQFPLLGRRAIVALVQFVQTGNRLFQVTVVTNGPRQNSAS
jgi:hypothetical protein